jgi:hypothetical protein
MSTVSRRLMVGIVPTLLALASSPVSGAAQDEPTLAARPGRAIVLGTGFGTTIGLDVRVGSRTDLVLETALRLADDDDNTTRVVLFRPALKRYWGSLDSRVATYLQIGAELGWSHIEQGPAAERNRREFGGLVGIGVDWLPIQRVSIGGHASVGLSVSRTEQSGLLNPGTSTGSNIGTASSGIRLRLYL